MTSQPMQGFFYLGDGAYAAIEHGQIVLTTSDGIRVTNRIYLEPEVWLRLVEFVDRNAKERA